MLSRSGSCGHTHLCVDAWSDDDQARVDRTWQCVQDKAHVSVCRSDMHVCLDVCVLHSSF